MHSFLFTDMNILKEIIRDPNSLEIDDQSVVINKQAYDKTQYIVIEGTTKNSYTLEQLAFFLTNKTISYTKYLRLCKEQGMASVFYSDQKIILDAIEKCNDTEIEAYCDLPETRYLSKHDYSWIKNLINEKFISSSYKNTEKYRIIVPPSLTSVISLSNIETFLTAGRLEKQRELVFDKLELTIEKKTFVIEEDVSSWTYDDWNMLVCIFCDGSDWQIKEWGVGDVASLFVKIPSFVLVDDKTKLTDSFTSYNITKINLKDNKVTDEDYKNIWKKINDFVNSSLQ